MNSQKEFKWKVCVRCVTYNHAKYIVDALNGFCMQETDFPFVCVVIDDASTDGEPEVIERYLEDNFELKDQSISRKEETEAYYLTFAQHKINKNCFFQVYFLKYNHHQIKKSKAPYYLEVVENANYLAFCEGDDYWINPKKLQMQVDFFANQLNVGIVYTAYRFYNCTNNQSRDVFTDSSIKNDESFKWRLLERKVSIGTCTTMIKTSLYKKIRLLSDDYKGFSMGDTQTWFNASRLSQVGYINEVTSLYRKHLLGATSSFLLPGRIQFIQNSLKLHMHLASKYGAPIETIKEIKRRFGFYLLNLNIKNGDYKTAQRINNELFDRSKYIHFILFLCNLFKIKNIKGFVTFLRFSSNLGLINFK